MSQTSSERARSLAQNLVEILSSYEEELMALELDAIVIGPLRRAVGITVAEACYLITDHDPAEPAWAPPTDGSTRRAG